MFKSITLHHIDPPVTIEGEQISFPEGRMDVAGWKAWKDRVDRCLRTLKLVEPVKSQGASYGGHPFLVNNLKMINTLKRGYIKPAPWWLRPFFGAVVTKERYD